MDRVLTTNLLTQTDCCYATGISARSVSKAIKAGILPAGRQGGRYCVLPADLYEYAVKVYESKCARMYPLFWIRNHLATFHGYEAPEGAEDANKCFDIFQRP